MRGRVGLLASAAAIVLSVVGAPIAGAMNMGSDPSMPSMALNAKPPLAGGVSDGLVTVAVVPMGHLNDPANTFFQTFTSTQTAPSWTASTPSGIATNGGIAVGGPTHGAVGVFPFYALKLSAVNGLQGGVPTGYGEAISALAPVPSAIAHNPQSGALAYVTAKGTILEQTSISAPLQTVTTRNDLRSMSGASACNIQAVTAVAFSATGRLGIGVRCAKAGTTAVLLATSPSSFQMISASNLGVNTVVRLDSSGSGFLALLRTGGMHAVIRAVSVGGIDGATVVASRPFPIMNYTLRSTAVATGGSEGSSAIVTLAGTKHAQVIILRPASANVLIASFLPLSTQAVVSTAPSNDVASGLTAFEVKNGTAELATYGANGQWSLTATKKVVIPYGSSV